MDTPATVSPLTWRAYEAMPTYVRDADEALAFPLLTWWAALLEQLANLDQLIDRIAFIPPDEGGPPDATSDLIDPATGDPAWLPAQALIYGTRLDASLPVSDQRAQILEQRSGPRRGSKPSIAAAAAAVLSGTKSVTVLPLHFGDWTIGVQVIATELPAGGHAAVVQAILDADVKPAGYELTVFDYNSSWTTQEADFPTWDTRDAASWTQVESAT